MMNFKKGRFHLTTAQCKYCKRLFQAQSKQKKVCFDCKCKNNKDRINKKNADERKLKKNYEIRN